MMIVDFWATILFSVMIKVIKVEEVHRVETEHQSPIKSLMTRMEVSIHGRVPYRS
jgi:hypothetical protein